MISTPTGECHQLSLEGSPYRSVHKEEKKRVFDTVACGRKGRLVTLCNSYGLSLAWPTIKTCLSVTTMKVVDHDAVRVQFACELSDPVLGRLASPP